MTPFLDIATAVVQIIGLPLAAMALYLNSRNAARSRDLDVALRLTDQFNARWSEDWRRVTRLAEDPEFGVDGLTSDDRDKLVDLLNYIDHIGRLMLSKHLRDDSHVVRTIGPLVRRALSASEELIATFREDDGKEVFRGALYFSKRIARLR